MPYAFLSLSIKKHLKKSPLLLPRVFKHLLIPRKITGTILLITFAFVTTAQEQALRYSINRHGKQVGSLDFKKVKSGSTTAYVVESDVKVSMILSFHVQAKESSLYINDVLQSSSLYRKVNGSEKINQQIKNNGAGLTVTEDGKEKLLKNFSVKYNMHCLYAHEPTFYTNVFSDNYQQFIPIVKIAEHQYKVSFPDGNSNEYFYAEGVCKQVSVRSKLFDAEFMLIR